MEIKEAIKNIEAELNCRKEDEAIEAWNRRVGENHDD